jgi:hypothetical protein
MVGEANQKAIEAAGLSFILGAKIPHEPYVAMGERDPQLRTTKKDGAG